MNNPFDFTKLLAVPFNFNDERGVYLVTPGPEPHPIAEIDCNTSDPGAIARRISATLTACSGLDLPADVEPGTLAELVALCRDRAHEFRGESAVKLQKLLTGLRAYAPADLSTVATQHGIFRRTGDAYRSASRSEFVGGLHPTQW